MTAKIRSQLAMSATWLKRSLKWALWVFGGASLLIVVIDIGTSYWVRAKVYTDIAELPAREYAVVLGTAKFYTGGAPNLYYKYRLEAARQVLDAHKVQYLLLSGDNQTPYYNEPKMMTADLQKMGIPRKKMRQDYAGYSTFDSVIRADKVFKLPPFTIISQQFHCERALLVAQFKGIDAICYAATYPDNHYKVRIREFFARTVTLARLILGMDATTLAPSRIVELPKKA